MFFDCSTDRKLLIKCNNNNDDDDDDDDYQNS
jgi:hypothetical protein